MRKEYLELAAKMLSDYADLLGNRCCNDWDFPEGWSEDLKREFAKAYHEYNGDPEEYDENNLSLSDFCVADLLSDILKPKT